MQKPLPADATSHEDALAKGSYLVQAIQSQLGSLEQLKSSFSAAVLGMFSSGWMWFVCDEYGRLAIYPTFGTGTLLIRSRRKMADNIDPVAGETMALPLRPQQNSASATGSAPSSPASGIQQPLSGMHPPTHTRTFSGTAVSSFLPRPAHSIYTSNPMVPIIPSADALGDVLYPLFCVSVHEHAWVGAGYGVWGKEEYLKRFWTVLDWEHVVNAFNRCRNKGAQP
jgi:Fe-Mn family superoxide dismutase